MDGSSSNATHSHESSVACAAGQSVVKGSDAARTDSKSPERGHSVTTNFLVRPALIVLSVVALLAPALICFLFIKDNTVNVPYMDDWSIVGYAKQLHSGQLDLLSFINVQDAESKMFVPFSFLVGIGNLTKFNYASFTSFTFACVALKCAILMMLAWPLVRTKRYPLLWVAPIAWITFSVRSWETLLWAPAVAYTLCIVALLSTVAFLNQSRRIDLPFAGAALSALIASYCIANGLTVWLLGILQLLLQRFYAGGRPKESALPDQCRQWWQKIVVWTVLTFAVITNYVHSLYPVAHRENNHAIQAVSRLLHDLPGALHFSFVCMGSPLSTDKYTATGMGCALLFLFITALFSSIRISTDCRRQITVPITVILFAFGSIALITIGRFPGGLDAALQSRYCETTNLVVSGLYLLLLSLGESKSQFDLVRMGMLLGLIGFGSIATFPYGVSGGDQLRASRIALADVIRHYDIQSDAILNRYADVGADTVRPGIDYLKQHNMSLFANAAPIDLSALQTTDAAPCFLLKTINTLPVHTYPLQKHAVVKTKLEPALEFQGWAFSFVPPGPAPAVYVSIDGKLDIPTVVGLPERDLEKKYRRRGILYSGFVGICRSNLIPAGVHTVTLKIVSPDRHSYYISKAQATLEIQ